MVARLITMNILTYKSGNIRRYIFTFKYRRSREKSVEAVYHFEVAAIEISETFKILRRKPCVLPSITFAIIIFPMVGFDRVERSPPTAVCKPSASKKCKFIKIVSIRVASGSEVFSIFCLAHIFSCISYCTVSNGIFHVIGNRFII